MAVPLRTDPANKSSVDEIRKRFDGDVERFSNLETGQSASVDSPLMLSLVTEAAARTTPAASRVLDVGCGAGNYTLKLLEQLPGLHVTALDLSGPMLDRAESRLLAAGASSVRKVQQDIRDFHGEPGSVDIIVAAMVLHHLRTDDEWLATYRKLYNLLAPGGSLWVADLVDMQGSGARTAAWRRYAEYLEQFRGPEYREQVMAYIDREDTPRPVVFQLDAMRAAGFVTLDVLHANSVFAAFGGMKG
ncbi:methyltransferase domain-containing protein [bacterium]|nr:methyltransferase domain-containing protein [bacterium]